MGQDIEQKILDFIIDVFLFGEPVEVGPDESLLEKGIIDSTGLLELVEFLQETYDITIQESDLVRANLDGIAKIAAFVQRKQAAGGEAAVAESGASSAAPQSGGAPSA